MLSSFLNVMSVHQKPKGYPPSRSPSSLCSQLFDRVWRRCQILPWHYCSFDLILWDIAVCSIRHPPEIGSPPYSIFTGVIWGSIYNKKVFSMTRAGIVCFSSKWASKFTASARSSLRKETCKIVELLYVWLNKAIVNSKKPSSAKDLLLFFKGSCGCSCKEYIIIDKSAQSPQTNFELHYIKLLVRGSSCYKGLTT